MRVCADSKPGTIGQPLVETSAAGALDAIADVIGVVAGFAVLKVERSVGFMSARPVC